MLTPQGEEPAEFAAAAAALRGATLRSELTVREIPSPERIAPFSVAFGAGVTGAGSRHRVDHDELDSAEGAGRLILLYNPAMVSEWQSPFRVVCYAQAPLEVEIGTDPFIADVTWSWLVDALSAHGAAYTQLAGTATKTLSTGYGMLADQGDGAQLELRASWSPVGSPDDSDFAAHAHAWSEVLCLLAGLPHEEGVVSLGMHRNRRAQHPVGDPHR